MPRLRVLVSGALTPCELRKSFSTLTLTWLLPPLPLPNPRIFSFPWRHFQPYAKVQPRDIDSQPTDVFDSILKIEVVVKVQKLGNNKLWCMHTMDYEGAVNATKKDLHELIIG